MSGRLANSPGEIIAQLLEDLSLGGAHDAASWPIFYANAPEGTTDNLISVYDTEGRIQGRLHVTGVTQQVYGIQVITRSNNASTSRDKSDEIAHSLDTNVNRRSVTVDDLVGTGTTTYTVHSISRASGPFYLGLEQGTTRERFSLNLLATISQN